MSDLTSKQRSDLSNAIWDALDDHGHNGIECRPEKPMDYTADHVRDSLTPLLAAMLTDASREGAAEVAQERDNAQRVATLYQRRIKALTRGIEALIEEGEGPHGNYSVRTYELRDAIADPTDTEGES